MEIDKRHNTSYLYSGFHFSLFPIETIVSQNWGANQPIKNSHDIIFSNTVTEVEGTMPFPENKRILYKKNPLDRVICQLRFPAILRIETEIPSEFQEKIRRNFPNFLEKSEVKVEMPMNVSGQVGSDFPVQLTPKASKNYEFSSENEEWTFNLTRSFIALTTSNYTRWEQFKEILSKPLQAFVDIYAPEHLPRIGLRYIDIIKRSKLGLEGVSWNELLQPYVLGMLSTDTVGKNIEGYESKNEIKLEDGTSVVRIITSLIQDAETEEICFLIDSDFFTTTKTKIDQAIDKLDYFNARGSRLIQWCITERLHTAMEPELL